MDKMAGRAETDRERRRRNRRWSAALCVAMAVVLLAGGSL
jgi:hypothetical protein